MIDVGQGPVTPGGGPGVDGFVGRYSASTGTASWSKRLVGPGDDQITSVVNGPKGNIYVGGWFDQSTMLVGGSDTRTFTGQGDRDIFIAQLNGASGEVVMTKTFAGPGFEEPTSLAWTGSNIIAAGFFAGTTAFGAQTLSSTDFDIWVAKLAPTDGTPLWAIRLGGLGPDKYPDIVVDSAGDIYLAAFITGSAMFGPYAVGGVGGTDGVVAKLRNSDGAVVWATTIGSVGDDVATSITINANDQLLVTSSIGGPLQPGGPFFGDIDVALISYDKSGARLWTKVIGTSGPDYPSSVAIGATGAFYADVNLGGSIGAKIEGVPIQGAPNPMGLLLKLQP
jgi:hypothetical protein